MTTNSYSEDDDSKDQILRLENLVKEYAKELAEVVLEKDMYKQRYEMSNCKFISLSKEYGDLRHKLIFGDDYA